ncbi:hypothetical protein FACS1894186_0010 [Alphaproteobacteria bacterium]|nr:hypothetical protein FACS1894186_0010 [Alphaproteobacteria bacterium]
MKTRLGKPGITFVKNMPDGTVLYVEEARNGKKQLAYETLYKKRRAITSADSLRASLISTPETSSAVKIIPGRTDSVNTGSPAFARWFGDSKVVDAEGRPLVVYHRTDESFNTFDSAKIGSRNIEFGKGFYFADSDEYTQYGKNVMPVYLSLQNPFIVQGDIVNSDGSIKWADKFIQQVNDALGYKNIWDGVGREELSDALGKAGYDGIINADMFIAFRPEQIKSVDNRGTWDAGNPNIYHQADIAPEIRNKRVKVVDLTGNNAVPTKEALEAKINGLIKNAKPIPTQSLDKLIDFQDDGRNIAGHLVGSSRQNLNEIEKAQHKMALGSIEDLIRESVFVEKESNAKRPSKPNVEEYYLFYVPVLLGRGEKKKAYTVRLVAEKWVGESQLRPDVSHLYDVIIEKSVATSKGKNPIQTDGSNGLTIKVSQMLSGVKGFDGTEYRQDRARGSIEFDKAGAVINLFKTADKSTLPHELWHFFRRDMEALAADPRAPEWARRDWQTLLKWVGSADGRLTREQEEKVARAGEAYLREGKAPSLALRQVFARFRRWLVSVYKSVKQLQIVLDDDIRGVFDRLLATEEEISVYEKLSGYDEALRRDSFTDEASYQEYLRLADEAHDEAVDKLLKAELRAIRQRGSKKYDADWEKAVAKAKALVDGMTAFKLDTFLREGKVNGETFEGVHKIGAEYLAAYNMSPSDLPPEVVSLEGLDPAVVSDLVGYATPAEMFADLRLAADKDDAVEKAALEIMDETGHAPPSPEAMRRQAMESIYSRKRLKLMLTEARLLEQKTGRPQAPDANMADMLVNRDTEASIAAHGLNIELEVSRVERLARALMAKGGAEQAASVGYYTRALATATSTSRRWRRPCSWKAWTTAQYHAYYTNYGGPFLLGDEHTRRLRQ